MPNKEGPTAIHSLFAKGGPDSLENLTTHALRRFTQTPGNGVLSLYATKLTDLQKSLVESRTESPWTTSNGATLPPAKATLTSQVSFNYGEVLSLLSAVNQIDPVDLVIWRESCVPDCDTF